MIIVTGAAGFIGSCLISRLNRENFNAIVAVDSFVNQDKNKNLIGKSIQQKVDRNEFFGWLNENFEEVEFIFHIGARTDTAEFDKDLLWKLNTEYSKEVWRKCEEFQIPLIYASSAATYGLGELGYQDDEENINRLQPLNPYGESKNEFDDEFIGLARSVYFENDKRAAVKREINLQTGSQVIEEKEYVQY